MGLKSSHTSKFGTDLIHKYPQVPNTTDYTIATSTIQPIPILNHPITTYKLILPNTNVTCSLKFYDDATYGIPYIKSIAPSSYIGQQQPKISLTQQYFISLNEEEPIHATSAAEEFQRLRKTHATKTIIIQLSRREPTHSTHYEELWTKFDQLRPVIATNEVQDTHISKQLSTHSNLTTDFLQYVPTVSILTHFPLKPIAHKNILDCFDKTNPHQAQWKHTAFSQYDKNASYRVFTKPQPI